ncbi:hypothetical protein SGGMMB4_00037 [Sodalis glossinidius str. 'morsitans']|uniref:Uncharacterized protein n=1 Tax=Sodalis glossinidius (strain morsitans) TaxID=343509 RepID=A0A193QEM9_SODGM|nr:hypothetical protein SGGMMB4_00037 [Sodalis glossinidius str. 'morsitans']
MLLRCSLGLAAQWPKLKKTGRHRQGSSLRPRGTLSGQPYTDLWKSLPLGEGDDTPGGGYHHVNSAPAPFCACSNCWCWFCSPVMSSLYYVTCSCVGKLTAPPSKLGWPCPVCMARKSPT